MNLCKLILLVITLVSLFQFSSAHVGYVVTEDERERFAGIDFDFLLRALKNPFNVLLIFLTIVLVLLIYFLLKRSKFFMIYVARIEEKAESYYELISWMLRLGLGIAFIGAGVEKVLISPHYHLTSIIPVSPEMWVFSAGIIEFLVGLFLFLGFKTRLASAIAFIVLSLSFFYFGEEVYSHVTFFSVLSALFVIGGGKLSIDNIKI